MTKYSALLLCGELELFMVCELVFCICSFVGSWYCLWYLTKYSTLLFRGEVVLFVGGEKVFRTGVVWGAGTLGVRH